MEKSTTFNKEPTQDKTGHLGRFLDSLCSLGMTCRGGVPFCPHGLYSERCMVVLRAANQNLLIAGGNHSLIPPMNHRRYIGYTVYGAIPSTRTGYICHVAGGRLPPLHTHPLCARCSYNAERGTAPHPPPTAVPLPRRGRSCIIPHANLF